MNAHLLEGTGLSRHYTVSRGLLRKGTLKALDGVSFTLAPGKTLAVVGESGCGKTTLARLVTLIEPPTAGSLSIAGMNAVAPPPDTLKALRRTVQMVFQDPYGSLNPRKKVGSLLEEPLRINTSLGASQRREAARAMMARVGLRQEHYGRYPHMFSGGQRQRIAIARALMLHPRVVVADEPVSALDVSIQAQVLNLMMDLQDEFELAYLFISHDLSVVRHISSEVLVMYLGRTAEQGPKELIFERQLHPYTRALMASTPSVDPALRHAPIPLRGEPPSPLDPPPGCAFHQRCPFAEARCAEEVPALRLVEGRQVACHLAGAV
jgi:dipeptide transport system ATP-binding protein